MTKQLILVIGATGTIGSEVVKQLTSAGERVRVLVREPAKGARWPAGSVEIAVGDLSKPESLAPAFAGVERAADESRPRRKSLRAHGS